jgi:hypothetical protein
VRGGNLQHKRGQDVKRPRNARRHKHGSDAQRDGRVTQMTFPAAPAKLRNQAGGGGSAARRPALTRGGAAQGSRTTRKPRPSLALLWENLLRAVTRKPCGPLENAPPRTTRFGQSPP